MKNELMTDIESDSKVYTGNAMVQWKTGAKGTLHEAPATRALLDQKLYNSTPFRKPTSYQNQRNYYGLFYFSQTRTHLWHESLNEANMMMYLDHVESITAIASQPFKVVFADGGWHVPDLFALHANGRQMVYDIKPAQNIDSKEMVQFAKTQALCNQVGWGYRVLPGLSPQLLKNLKFLALFRHPSFAPPEANVSAMLAALDQPHTFDEAAHALSYDSTERSRSGLMHLLWMRIVRLDMNSPISTTSLIERNSDVDA
jgi:hypothetical protein